MIRLTKQVLVSGALMLTTIVSGAQVLPYKNPKLPVDVRVKDLMSRMTPEEKFWQLFMIPGDLDQAQPGQYRHGIFGFQVSAASQGHAGAEQMLQYNTKENGLALVKKINAIQKYFVTQTRLGIPIIAFDEALHGLVREGSTAFPQAIGLAASFDTTLMRRVSSAIAEETQARGIRQILSPVVNVASDVRWGRVEETYGEDPVLTSAMGVAFVSSFEKRNIITTPKHFLANVGDGGRDSYPIHWNERYLEEIHFPPFKACFSLGGSRSVMTSYNSIDGTAASMNTWLLRKKLKQAWKFPGFVISDAGAVGGSYVLHLTTPDYPTSGKQAVEGGLDVIFQTAYDHHTLFMPPFVSGQVNQSAIDEAVARVLRAKFELGLFEQPYMSEDKIRKQMQQPLHKPLAREAARASMVLLRNERQTLPLRSEVKRIAVVGVDATEARLGGYSGPGNGKVSMLDGIKARAKGATVSYAPGCGRTADTLAVVAAEFLSHDQGAGLRAEYFSNITVTGKPADTRTDAQVNFYWTFMPPANGLATSYYSVRWSGYITAPQTGNYQVGLEGNDGYRLYIEDKLVAQSWQKQGYHTTTGIHHFEKGQRYRIRIEFYEPVGNGKIKLVWNAAGVDTDIERKISEAVRLAQQSDIVVVTAGIIEGEFQDRAMLSLPGRQEEMIRRLADTGKPVVVVLVGGSAVVMSNWMDRVQAILLAWYPGEEGGHAVAEVLFGDYSPAGRLPITFPRHEAQLPLVYNHKPTGRGDDYNNLTGMPAFPFGYGLSYTQFAYSNLRISATTIDTTSSVTVTCDVQNTGAMTSDEVVQLYLADELSSVARPVMELKGFQRITLKPGETQTVSFRLTPAMLKMLNTQMKWVIEPGDFRVMVGASSRDIRLMTRFRVKE